MGVRRVWANHPRLFLLVPLLILALCGAFQAIRVLFFLGESVSMDFCEMMIAGSAQRLVESSGLAGIYAPAGTPYGLPGVAYPLLFLVIDAGLVKAGLGAVAASRLLAWLGYALAAVVAGLIVHYETGKNHAQSEGSLLTPAGAAICAALFPFCFWNVIAFLPGARVDGLAIAFVLVGVYSYRRRWPLAVTIAFFVIAIFTKQTMLAAPAAVALDLLLAQHFKRFAVFVFGMAGALLAVFALINVLSQNTFATIFDPARAARFIPLDKAAAYWAIFLGNHVPLLLIGVVCLVFCWRAGNRFWTLYAGLAFALVAATIIKDGAVDYYFNETSYIVAVQVAILVKNLMPPKMAFPSFSFPISQNGDAPTRKQQPGLWRRFARVMPILLMIQALIAVVMIPKGDPAALYGNQRAAYNDALAIVRNSQEQHRSTLVMADNLLLATGRVEAIGDYLIYSILVGNGRSSIEPLLHDITAHKYALIVLERGGFAGYPEQLWHAFAASYTRRDLRGLDGTLLFSIFS